MLWKSKQMHRKYCTIDKNSYMSKSWAALDNFTDDCVSLNVFLLGVLAFKNSMQWRKIKILYHCTCPWFAIRKESCGSMEVLPINLLVFSEYCLSKWRWPCPICGKNSHQHVITTSFLILFKSLPVQKWGRNLSLINNYRVILSWNYRLIVAQQKFHALKTNVSPRGEASVANMLVFFQGATIRPIDSTLSSFLLTTKFSSMRPFKNKHIESF